MCNFHSSMTEDNFDWLCDVCVCVSLFKIMVHTDLVLTLWLPFIFIITLGRTIVHQSALRRWEDVRQMRNLTIRINICLYLQKYSLCHCQFLPLLLC